MIIAVANVLMALCLTVFIVAWLRAVYHQWFRRGSWEGLIVWTLIGLAAGGLGLLIGFLGQPYR